jgi:hypothetical protein
VEGTSNIRSDREAVNTRRCFADGERHREVIVSVS